MGKLGTVTIAFQGLDYVQFAWYDAMKKTTKIRLFNNVTLSSYTRLATVIKKRVKETPDFVRVHPYSAAPGYWEYKEYVGEK